MNSNTIGKALIVLVCLAVYSWLLLDIGKSQGKASAELECTETVFSVLEKATSFQNHLEDSTFNGLLLRRPLPTPAPKLSPSPTPNGKDFHL